MNNVLEISITGNNSDLKKSLQDSRAELKKFAEEIKKSGGNSGIDALKKELNDARIAAVKFSADVKASLAESLNNAKKYTEGAKQATESYKQSLLDAKKAVDAQRAATESARTATEQERAATERQRTALAEIRAELARLTLEKRKSQQATVAASGSYREAQQRLTALGKSIREAAGGFTNTSPAIRKQIQEYNQLNTKLKEFDKTMGNHQRNVGNYGSAFASAIPYIGQFTGAAGAATAGVLGLQKSFAQNIVMDAFKTALREISGSAEETDKNLDFLRKTSDRLGLDFMSTAQAFKQWQGAAKFSNLTADESRKIFESVANASAKMKLSSDQTTGAFLALSQMLSKGKVQAEELRGQLGERLPGAFALAAKAMGVTEQGLNKMLEKGEVVANDFLPKFAAQLDKSFGNDKTQRIDSMQASVNRLSNEFNNLFESEAATSFFTNVANGLTHLTSEINRLVNSKSWGQFWERLSEGGSSAGGRLMTGNDLRGQFLSTKTFLHPRQGKEQYYSMISKEEFDKELSLAIDHQKKMEKSSIALQAAMSTGRIKVTKAIEFEYKKQEALADRHLVMLQKISRQRGFTSFATSSNVNETIDSSKNKPKGKSQADLIKEANDALKGGQIDNLKGIDSELEKIDKKWDGILEKVNKVTNEGLKNQLKAQVEQGRELDKQLAKLDIWSKGAKLKPVGVSAGTVTPTFSSIPSIAPLQNSLAGFTAGLSKGLEGTDLLSKAVKSQFRREMSSIFSNLLNDVTNLNDGVFEVEKKYNDLRRNATKEQIEALNKMEQIEKRINNGLSNLLINVTKTFSSVGAGILSSAISTGISEGNFDDLKNLFSGKNKAMGYGALGSLLGGTIQGLSKQNSSLGQGLGGALSGAGTGAMIGSIIPGIGTAIGAAVGGIIGGIGGLLGSKKAREQERLQQEQLAESKRQTLLQERIASLSYTSGIVGSRTNLGTVTGFDRDAFGNIEGIVDGKNLKLIIERN